VYGRKKATFEFNNQTFFSLLVYLMFHDSISFSGEGGDFVGWQGESQSYIYLQTHCALKLASD
jgi:hypothetical protein